MLTRDIRGYAIAKVNEPKFSTKAAFMLILRRQNQRFETLIQNADPKRR